MLRLRTIAASCFLFILFVGYSATWISSNHTGFSCDDPRKNGWLSLLEPFRIARCSLEAWDEKVKDASFHQLKEWMFDSFERMFRVLQGHDVKCVLMSVGHLFTEGVLCLESPGWHCFVKLVKQSFRQGYHCVRGPALRYILDIVKEIVLDVFRATRDLDPSHIKFPSGAAILVFAGISVTGLFVLRVHLQRVRQLQ